MIKDLETFRGEIESKTGVRLTLLREDGTVVVGDTVVERPKNLDAVYSDGKRNITVFPIKIKGNLFYGVISGCGEPEKTYAMFISQMAESFSATEREFTKEEFYKTTLVGGISYSQGLKYAEKFSLPQLSATAIIVTVSPKDQDYIFEVLANYCDDGQDFAVKLGENKIVVIKYSSNKEEYRSVTEFAEFIWRTVYEETGVTVNVYTGGEVGSVLDIATSFVQAENAERICTSISAKGNVHSFREVTFIRMLEELPKQTVKEYLSTILNDEAKAVINDQEMSATAEEFLQSNLSISETSRKMYLHRNTLAYRLDKIEKGTGLNIRKFSDAMTFMMIKFMQKMVE